MGSHPAARSDPVASLRDAVWRAPLVPLALALTAGIVVDRYAGVPPAAGLVLGAGALLAWLVHRDPKHPGLPLVYLSLVVFAFGAVYHAVYRTSYRPDDIGNYATEDARPVLVRGVLDEEPAVVYQPPEQPLRSIPHPEPTAGVLRATALRVGDDWRPVSGRARLMVATRLEGLHVGDEVEVAGRLVAPQGPANPGEFDYAGFLLDQRIRCQVLVLKTAEAVTRLAERWPRSPAGWLAVARGWGQRQMQQILPHDASGVAGALLLGEGSTLTQEDWQKYIRTGVIHVLAISGQHLVVLAVFLWLGLRVLGVRRSRGAWFVGLFLLGYALLTGGRPPVMRSAVMVAVACGGLILRRQVIPANSFALSWLVVAGLNPTDLFSAGCQLSFLSVAVLYWGTSRWFQPSTDPLDQLVDATRPAWLRLLRWIGRQVAGAYAVTLAVWLALGPLVAAHYHMVSPVGLLLGPPLVLLTSVALVGGFLLLIAALIGGPLAVPFALVTRGCLVAGDALVDWADRLPGSHFYLPDIPGWWLWGFYTFLLAALTLPLLRRRMALLIPVGLGWLCVGLLAGVLRLPADEVRCTFLAVGHGGCTIIETPDGRTLLYDVGSLGGPDVTQRQLAPYLWNRGIRRIDEVFLSHADLDHFNGLIALLDRFAVGRISCTPTFADKPTAGVRLTVAEIDRRRVPVQIVRAGDHLSAGPVAIDVLHPPAAGPDGNENARSLVLLVRHAGHAVLLTGDLEGAGMDRVLARPAPAVDVLMAPHHGSRVSNTPALAAWARPRVVVSCDGPPRGPSRPPEPYTGTGARFYGTWPHGAVTLRSHATGMVLETFRSRERIVVRRGGA